MNKSRERFVRPSSSVQSALNLNMLPLYLSMRLLLKLPLTRLLHTLLLSLPSMRLLLQLQLMLPLSPWFMRLQF